MKKIRPYLWRGGALVLAAAWAFRKGRGTAWEPLFWLGFLPGMAAFSLCFPFDIWKGTWS